MTVALRPARIKRAPHVIASITYPEGANDGPMRCCCGWEGMGAEFAAHRKAEGYQNAGSGNGYPNRNQWSYEPPDESRWASR